MFERFAGGAESQEERDISCRGRRNSSPEKKARRGHFDADRPSSRVETFKDAEVLGKRMSDNELYKLYE